MEGVDLQKLTKLYTYEELNTVNADLDKIYKELRHQTKDLEKPDSIVQRVFVDMFGVIALYLLLFFTCDITRSIVLSEPLFGFEWLLFGPYYFFTGAPLLTRVWKSKKFLEDLSEIKNGLDFNYPPMSTCTNIGEGYTNSCNYEETHPHRHPIRSKLGMGLDWIISHTIGKHFGGVLGSSNCGDQGTTIAADCALSRVEDMWACYQAVCDFYNLAHRADNMNWPNSTAGASGIGSFHGWDHASLFAYQVYNDCYLAVYDIGSTVISGHGIPSNLNPAEDVENYYSYNFYTLLNPNNNKHYAPFVTPHWYYVEAEMPYMKGEMNNLDFIRYYQLHYKEHMLDYWDTE